MLNIFFSSKAGQSVDPFKLTISFVLPMPNAIAARLWQKSPDSGSGSTPNAPLTSSTNSLMDNIKNALKTQLDVDTECIRIYVEQLYVSKQ